MTAAGRRNPFPPHLGEDLVAAAFAASPDCCIITRASDGVIVRLNHAWLELFGVKEEEAIGRTTLELGFFPNPDVRARLMAEFRRAGRLRDYELPVVARGREITAVVSVERIGAEKDGFILTVMRDVTELRRREREARLANHLFEAAFMASPDACFISDEASGRFVQVNEAWVNLFGFAPEEAIGKTAVEIGVLATAGERAVMHRHYRAAGRVRNFETTGRTRGGDARTLNGSIERIIIEGVPHVFGILRDVTDERRREREAAAAHQLFVKAFNASPDACVVTDETTSEIVRVNDAWERLMGFRSEEAVGRTPLQLHIFVAPEDRAAVFDRFGLHSALKDYELPVRIKNGDIRLVSIGMERIEVAGRPCILSIVRDVTAQREAERVLIEQADELRRSNGELEQFAYVSSHDLKEPLRKVASYAELLSAKVDGKLGPDVERYLAHITGSIDRMNRLIEDLLSFARIGMKKPPRERVDLGEVLRNVTADLDETIREKGATVQVGDLPTVWAVPSEMNQLFQNLVANALKFSRAGAPPRVEIAAERAGPRWSVTVQDNGIGIEPKYFETIFGVFQRLHPRHQYEGNGIGLAICRKIVERHGGRITVTSEPGQGTRFRLTLPALKSEKLAI